MEIMRTWKNTDNLKPMVTIRCITYNQEKYIAQTLEGFLIQITDFTFEIFVHDDASTDHTPDILREYEAKYPKLINVVYETENLYSRYDGSLTKVIDANMNGKYEAFCEGDDYWIDPYKLQKQVDFLERHENYVACFTNFNIYYQVRDYFEKNVITTKPRQFLSEYTLEQFVENCGYTAPMTWVYRHDMMKTFKFERTYDGSFLRFAHFLACGKVKCMEDETTAVYRVLTESASHSINPNSYYLRIKNLKDTQLLLTDKYHLGTDMRKRIIKQYYKKAFYLMCIVNDKEEIDIAEKYCRSFKEKVFMTLCKMLLFRKGMCCIYKQKHRRQ